MNKKNTVLQIRLTELEKNIIKNKASLLNLSVTDYIKQCCIFNNTTKMFMDDLHKSNKNNSF
jgi:hypothetical protein